MIRAIIFDFGNVVCTFDMKLFGQRLSQLSGIPIERFDEMMKVSYHLSREYETGLVTSDEFYAHVTTKIGSFVDKREFIRAFSNIFTPIPSTFRLIKSLKPAYKLGLLSNTNEWHYEYGIKTVEVYPLFDAVTLSFQVKAMKPDERIYRDALSKLGCPPEQCVYIDDLQENVDAAAGLGITGIRYTGHAALIDALRAAGVAAGVDD